MNEHSSEQQNSPFKHQNTAQEDKTALQIFEEEQNRVLVRGAITNQIPAKMMPDMILQLQPIIGNQAVIQLLRQLNQTNDLELQRTINWDPNALESYKQSAKNLVDVLANEFYYIKRNIIKGLVEDIEKRKANWTPYQAYQGIKQHLQKNYALPPSEVEIGQTTITNNELEWYFLQNFKTMAEIVLDGKYSFKFQNTPDDDHAEDNMMREINKFIEKENWHENFSGNHTFLMQINNSPCQRCAPRLYNWKYRDIFVDFVIQFANMYEKDAGFTEATTKLRSGGITMELFSVTDDLVPLIKRESKIDKKLIDNRKKKDQQESSDWNAWQEKK